MENTTSRRPTARVLWIALSVVLVAALAAAAWLGMGSGLRSGAAHAMGMMGPTPMPASAIVPARVGAAVELAVIVSDVSGTKSMRAALLDTSADGSFVRTSETVNVAFDADTRVVMGTIAGVRPGAVLQIHGVVSGPAAIDADRLVVLTGYAKVR